MVHCCILAIIIINICVLCKSERCDVFKNLTAMIVDDHYNFKEVFLEGGADDLKDVLILQVVGQKIPKLCKRALEGLSKLMLIRLQDCEIDDIEDDAFGGAPSLKTITLTGNRFERILRGAFSDLPVRILNLPDNQIKRIEVGAFQNLPLVEEVNLSKNNLSEFNPDWFRNTRRLRKINLVNNSIEVIPEDIFVNVRIDDSNASFDLWLMNNNIRRVHGNAFNGVKNIGDLWLDNNNLAGIDGKVFQNVQKIRTLSLTNNNLTCLADEFLSHSKVDVLMISGNPWNCDCLSKILEWVEKNNVLCEVPKRFSGCSLKNQKPINTTLI